MPHQFRNADLLWTAHVLQARSGKGPAVRIVPDETFLGMWRVQSPDGTLSDMASITRAREAARAILLAILNGEERRAA
jgi:hypothetical protein